MVASGAADGVVALWDTRSGRLLRLLGPAPHPSPVLGVSVNPVSGHVAAVRCVSVRVCVCVSVRAWVKCHGNGLCRKCV